MAQSGAYAGVLNVATSDATHFSNTKARDVVLKTTYDTQTVHIGPSRVNNDPSTVSIAWDKMTVVGDIHMTGTISSSNAKSSFGGLRITKGV